MSFSNKTKFGIFLLIIALSVAVVGIVVGWPFAILWAVNNLFCCLIPFTFVNWLSTVIILITLAALFQTTR